MYPDILGKLGGRLTRMKKGSTKKKKFVISVVVIGLNEEKLVGRCMDSLVHQDFDLPFEVVFADSGSTDNTVRIVSSYAKRLNLKIVRYKSRGIGEIRQEGFQKASAPIICSTDSDSFVPSDWVRMIYEYFHSHKNSVGVMGPYVTYPASFFERALFLVGCRLIDHFTRIISGFYNFRGMNFAVRKHTWKQTGGFERSISALEDVDLALKVTKLGKIDYLPNLVVSTTPRRFGTHVWASMIYRLNAYYYRVYARDYTKYTRWEQIRD
jgi:glycosyltransferase involved in cell wall biosynthesis